ncbi:endonuclease/exonuclease/phosphatase family protein [Sulfitobacter sp. D35]|uniref:endonuclease/exonuclease/phosphatase family protein n=1 Tax=Sulfitobacter sp. D35 TaxID=3083252 RepID=UPI00296E9E3C|nr:endonuclease/exonuclease/phosphatase family protein [Sulfitobacter sp. D35]MDW4499444.1 endonuclease/exonuclease/phosphatase family protein [Sulfitobacter sp. D35]
MSADADRSLRLASYNVRKAVGTDWRRDPRRIGQVIASLAADIVVLQEADKRLGARPSAIPREVIEDATGLVPVEVGQGPRSLGWHGIAVLLRPDITVNDVTRIDLPGMEPRGAVIADLVRGDQHLRLIGVHLGLLRRARRRQLSHLTEVLGNMGRAPTVIAGDFNEWSLEVGLGRLARGFAIHAPGPSFHAAQPIAALDRIATNPLVHVLEMGVHRDRVSRRASDHLPIWARVDTSAEDVQPEPSGKDGEAGRGENA